MMTRFHALKAARFVSPNSISALDYVFASRNDFGKVGMSHGVVISSNRFNESVNLTYFPLQLCLLCVWFSYSMGDLLRTDLLEEFLAVRRRQYQLLPDNHTLSSTDSLPTDSLTNASSALDSLELEQLVYFKSGVRLTGRSPETLSTMAAFCALLCDYTDQSNTNNNKRISYSSSKQSSGGHSSSSKSQLIRRSRALMEEAIARARPPASLSSSATSSSVSLASRYTAPDYIYMLIVLLLSHTSLN
jgi:hypothetical protein